MEEEKYYIPDIEEFHIGFECELHMSISTNFCRSNKETWNKMIMHETDILYNIKNYTEKGKIRVKFLDREDIEAEGWEQIEYDIYVFGLYVLEFNPEYYTYIYLASHKPDVIFKGKIRNRSELRKLMKQLNIE